MSGSRTAVRERIPVFYDFASTICFVAHRTLERMAGELDRLGVELALRPIDFARITGWPRGAVMDGPRRENALRVARELGVEVKMPGRWLDSRRAHAVALGLAGEPKEAAWRERVWSAIFDEGRDVGSAEEIERLCRDLGIDASRGGTEELTRLEAETDAARRGGVHALPSFVLGGYPLPGIHPADTMLSMFARFLERRRRDSKP